MLYPSSVGNRQFFYIPSRISEANDAMKNKTSAPFDMEFIANVSGADRDTILWWELYPEERDLYDMRLLVLPSSLTASNGKIKVDVDCDLNFEDAHQRGHTNKPGEWQNVEITAHMFVKSVTIINGYIDFEARIGMGVDERVGCCQDVGYGVKLYWDNGGGPNKGKFAFFKTQIGGNSKTLAAQSQTIIPTFYQQWFGVKFVIYNLSSLSDWETDPQVKLELWLSPVTFGNPSHVTSNNWQKAGEIIDRIGNGWEKGARECGVSADNFPITWANPFVAMGYRGAKIVQFNYASFREIEPDDDFSGEPEPPVVLPPPDPNAPPPDPNPPSIPEPPPPDAEPAQTPTTLTKRLVIRREIANNSSCTCDGVLPDLPDPPPPPPGGGGGGGGSAQLRVIYDTPLVTTDIRKLALVAGSTAYSLRFGQAVTQNSSAWIGKIIGRVEITIAKFGNPLNGASGGLKCVIRKPDDSIAATLTPTVSTADILTGGKLFVFENLTNTYKMQFNSKVLFEFDGGDRNNYIILYARDEVQQTGTKIVWQNNTMETGEYLDSPPDDLCMKVSELVAPSTPNDPNNPNG